MCGIVGIISANQSEVPSLKKRIQTMNDEIRHRGPDAEGVWIDSKNRAGLGHRRLSIVDLTEAGRQPMGSLSSTLQIVFNGEIYNHLEIRAELEKLGYKYHSGTDTETILYAFEEWGEQCIDRLRGMFAFAIYNPDTHELFFARDRIGIKPFYYAIIDDQFIFASEIKSILALTDFPRKLNRTAVYHYLSVFAVPAPLTMFEGISKVPAGWSGTFINGQLSLKQYWDLPLSTDTKTSESDWQAEIKTGLLESVKLRMMSDVPFGAYLSGGIDSSTLAVMMNNEINRPLDTFTVGFKNNQDLNETDQAKYVSDQYKFNYHEILIDKPELKKLLPKLNYQTDEPNGDWVCFPLYYVSKLIRDNKVIVAQVGEGSDELFCGYSGYLLWLNVDKATRWLRVLPKPILEVGYRIATKYRHHSRGRFIMNLFYNLKERQELFMGGAVAFTEPEKRHILTQDFLSTSGNPDTYDVFRPYLDKAKQAKSDRLQQMTYIEFKHRLPEILLMRVDKISMAHAIEARVPFLDHKFVERMFQIPTALKIKKGVTKRMLKEALRGVIPDTIIDRKKLGFLAPVAEWLCEPEFMNEMKTIVLSSKIMDEHIFEKDKVEELFQDYYFPRNGHRATQIWILVQLSLWYNTWFQSKSES